MNGLESIDEKEELEASIRGWTTLASDNSLNLVKQRKNTSIYGENYFQTFLLRQILS
jgi:hypothetical protein